MSAGSDRLLASHTKALELCTYCPKLCRHSCPVANATGKETLTPQSKMQLLNLLRRDVLPRQAEYLQPAYGCTGCRLCQQYCRHENDVAAALRDGRALAIQRGLDHPRLHRLPELFRSRNERLRARLQLHLPPERLAAEARVGFMPGCDTIDDAIGDIDDACRVFDALGLDFVKVVDGPLVCAGYPLWAAGHDDHARYVAEELAAQLRRFSTVILGCPACVYLLREKLPAEGLTVEPEVLHLAEYLFLHAERLPIRRQRAAAYYHDPCFLGRYLEVYQPPRRLIERCVESPREFFHARELADCCGGGGLLPHTDPAAAAEQARQRLSELEVFGVDLVVTACPTCRRTLASGAARLKTRVEVLELTNLLAWCTAGESQDERAS